MGVYDRSYMKIEGEGRSGPLPPRPSAPWSMTTKLIVANCVAFIVVRASGSWFRHFLEPDLMLSIPNLREGRWWTLLTAAFVHGDGWHIVFNMLALWFFGRFFEDRNGPRRLLAFCVITAVAAHIPFVIVEAARGASTATIGFSGVTCGLMVYAALREPMMRVRLYFVTMPLWVMAAIFVGIDTLGAMRLIDDGGRSVWVHIGGALCGVVVHRWNFLPNYRAPSLSAWFARRRAARAVADERDVQARVDRLLDKIAQKGMTSLTDEEREFLKRSSARYR